MNIPFQRYTRNLYQDTLAGITGAVAGAPQAMGFAILAGVSPLYGLYTAFVATILGGVLSSSTLITIGPTNALSLVVASTIGAYAVADQLPAMFVITILVGGFMLLIGLLRLGNLTQFVSNAVMTGFITGAGLLIMLGQLDHLIGYVPSERYNVPLRRFWDWLTHLDQGAWHVATVGGLSIVIIWSLHRTRLKSIATLVAMVVTTILVANTGWGDVPLVRDMSLIPRGLPGAIMPQWSLAPELISTAFAIAILAAVQSAALIQSTPQPERVNISRDFSAMGVANIVGGFLQGMPACASLSRTAVNVSAGARTRMANIYAGLFVGLILIVFGGWIERIPLAALAGHLMVAAASLVRPRDLRMVWQVSFTGRLVMTTTLVLTLLLPLEYSIYIGVGLSLLMYAYDSASGLQLTRLVPQEDGNFRREPVPESLPPNEPVILSLYGYMFFAAVRRVEALLPDARTADGSVVIVRVREHIHLGSTGIRFFEEYHKELEARGGRLILSGVSPALNFQLQRTGAIKSLGLDNIYYEDDIVFSSTRRAYADAQRWITQKNVSSKPPVPA
jgi:SulP family sulfate permease